MKIIENLSKEVEVIKKEPSRNHRTKKINKIIVKKIQQQTGDNREENQ